MSKSTILPTIKIVSLFCLVIIAASTAQKPEFPERMPIIERPFSKDIHKFSFAIIGDKTGGGLDKWHIFDRAMDEINILNPDFAIMVGDLIQGDTTDIKQLNAEWKEFWEHQDDLNIPFLPLPGNHDITNRVMYDYWVKHIGRTYSAFTYKNCLFLMLNTEEWHINEGEWTNWFGEQQIEYAKSQLKKHSDVRHTFVLMHRPLWLQKNSGWEEIEAELGQREYTVFAGHYHNLTLHTRNDRRYFVLGATGGGFTPQEVREYGAFDHYSLVTVDNDKVNVAIIEPGNIYPANISIATFKDKISSLLKFEPQFNLMKDNTYSRGNIEIILDNTFEKPVNVEIEFNENNNWQIFPNKLSFETKPGQLTKTTVNLSVRSDTLIPFPVYKYSVQYGGEQLISGKRLFHPIVRESMRVLKDWMLLGPFDLGLEKVPVKLDEIPQTFLDISLHKIDIDRTYHGKNGEIKWTKYKTESDRTKLREIFGDVEMAYGYGISYIKSPDSRKVFAQIGWGSNLGRIYLNNVEIPNAAIPGKHIYSWWAHFELPLVKGWNTLTILTADYNGWWDYRMEIADPTNDLQFGSEPENIE